MARPQTMEVEMRDFVIGLMLLVVALSVCTGIALAISSTDERAMVARDTTAFVLWARDAVSDLVR